jgi:hypothetical protein
MSLEQLVHLRHQARDLHPCWWTRTRRRSLGLDGRAGIGGC